MTVAQTGLPDLISKPTSRLITGLVLSVLVHSLLIAVVRPMASTLEARPNESPLQVEIRQEVEQAVTVTAAAEQPSLPSMKPSEGAFTAPSSPRAVVAPVTGLQLSIPLNEYYSARELDLRAVPLNDIALVYPQLAYQNRVRGKVLLRMLINERGGIDQLAVLESEPKGVFEEAALAAARALEFSPAKRQGRSVKSQKVVEVVFDPYENIQVP